MPSMVTSALVGVAGAFVGFHLAEALRLTAEVALLGAVVGLSSFCSVGARSAESGRQPILSANHP